MMIISTTYKLKTHTQVGRDFPGFPSKAQGLSIRFFDNLAESQSLRLISNSSMLKNTRLETPEHGRTPERAGNGR